MEICEITTGIKQAQIIKALAQSAALIQMAPKKTPVQKLDSVTAQESQPVRTIYYGQDTREHTKLRV